MDSKQRHDAQTCATQRFFRRLRAFFAEYGRGIQNRVTTRRHASCNAFSGVSALLSPNTAGGFKTASRRVAMRHATLFPARTGFVWGYSGAVIKSFLSENSVELLFPVLFSLVKYIRFLNKKILKPACTLHYLLVFRK